MGAIVVRGYGSQPILYTTFQLLVKTQTSVSVKPRAHLLEPVKARRWHQYLDHNQLHVRDALAIIICQHTLNAAASSVCGTTLDIRPRDHFLSTHPKRHSVECLWDTTTYPTVAKCVHTLYDLDRRRAEQRTGRRCIASTVMPSADTDDVTHSSPIPGICFKAVQKPIDGVIAEQRFAFDNRWK